MAIITIDSSVFCHGAEVAEKVADRLGYRRLDDEEILAAAAKRVESSVDRLRRVMYGPQPFFGGSGRERLRQVASLRVALVDAIRDDGVVYLGIAGHLLPPTLTHVLRVCLAGTRGYRLEEAVRSGLSRRDAERALRRDDESRGEWIGFLHGVGPWDKSLFDVFVAMQETTLDRAVEVISEHARRPAVETNERARAAVADLRLAAAVGLAAASRGHDVDVTCSDSAVTVLIKKHSLFLDKLQRELERIAMEVPGVEAAAARPGPRYREPGIGFNIDLEVPSKVLLVDDEQEFVHTLSERLQTRNIAPVIAYDGEGALEMVASDQPEVMVLDLKMPGIDGLEVLRRVKRTHPETEVIILTGHGSEAEERVAAELGAFAYLRKPVDIDVLTETMKEAYRKVSACRSRVGEE